MRFENRFEFNFLGYFGTRSCPTASSSEAKTTVFVLSTRNRGQGLMEEEMTYDRCLRSSTRAALPDLGGRQATYCFNFESI